MSYELLLAQRFGVSLVRQLAAGTAYEGWTVSTRDERPVPRFRISRIGGEGIENGSYWPTDDIVYDVAAIHSDPDLAEEASVWLHHAMLLAGETEPRVLSSTTETPPMEELPDVNEDTTEFGFAVRLRVRLRPE